MLCSTCTQSIFACLHEPRRLGGWQRGEQLEAVPDDARPERDAEQAGGARAAPARAQLRSERGARRLGRIVAQAPRGLHLVRVRGRARVRVRVGVRVRVRVRVIVAQAPSGLHLQSPQRLLEQVELAALAPRRVQRLVRVKLGLG